MSQITDPHQKELAGRLKNVMATYNEAEDLINIGAYKAGSNEEIDFAISKIDKVNAFLVQATHDKKSYDEIMAELESVFADDTQ